MIEYSKPLKSPTENISDKQWTILAFPYSDYDVCIAEGAVRSGKTMFSAISFIDWAMKTYNECNFAICGFTVKSVERNVILEYQKLSYTQSKYDIKINHSDSVMIVRHGSTINKFYIFGGGTERSYETVQGLTLAGALIDEVVLLRESFVNQVLTRLSIEGNKVFFTCNPASQQNWFYKRWIKREGEFESDIKILRLHFTLDDNPGLDDVVYKQLKSRWTKKSTHYKWYILGEWVSPEGLVYDNFDAKKNVAKRIPQSGGRYYVSVDYGITNPFAALLWRVDKDKAYIVDEVYIDSKQSEKRYTDEELYEFMAEMIGDRQIYEIIIDPSATSFKETIKRKRRYRVKNANNEVLAGIATTYSMLSNGLIKVSDKCEKGVLTEIYLYSWDENGKNERETVRKENDHAMDAMRYFAHTVLRREYSRKY